MARMPSTLLASRALTSVECCISLSRDCRVGCSVGGVLLSPINVAFLHPLPVSLHLYPSSWGKDDAWGTAWIVNHTAAAHAIGKPVVVGEFGVPAGGQSETYSTWTSAGAEAGTNGLNFWMMCGREDDGSADGGWYPNYDGE